MGAVDAVRAALRRTPIVADEEEFDPFAGESTDPEPGESEGDDRVHAEGE